MNSLKIRAKTNGKEEGEKCGIRRLWAVNMADMVEMQSGWVVGEGNKQTKKKYNNKNNNKKQLWNQV